MSAVSIKLATTTTVIMAAVGEDSISKNAKTSGIENDGSLIAHNREERSSFCTLPSLKELQTSLYRDVTLKENTVPLENSKQNFRHSSEDDAVGSNRDLDDFSKSHFRQGDIENTTTQLCPGLSILQQSAATSSPPPHSYRHSRAYRHFKNPPQPHMCIRTTTEVGEELFINVLSWTRIVIPQEPSDPIPLYGGMRVPPGSPRSPPIVFAVMANPEVLKDSGRHSKDPEERRAMVELMCDFVEAMNPGVKLVRNAVILKDRDISGELKDVWNAVQAQRDREREEQILLQRQQHQQHFHNLTNASTNGSSIISSSTPTTNSATIAITTQQMFSKSSHSGIDIEKISKVIDVSTPPRSRKNNSEVQNETASHTDIEEGIETTRVNNGQVSLSLMVQNLDNKMSIVENEKNEDSNLKKQSNQNNQNTLTNDALSNGSNTNDPIELEKLCKRDTNKQLNPTSSKKDVKKEQSNNGFVINFQNTEASNVLNAAITSHATTSIPALNPPTSIASLSTTQQAPPKKEKLGGFLPNGCIFPRFNKNNKHKDKDKEKDKEPKTKEKEKNPLLSALKKSKDKKTNAATNLDDKITSSNSKHTAINCNNSNTKHHKNCLQQLECGVQKLNLSNHHPTHIVENNSNNSSQQTILDSNISEHNKNSSSTSNNSDGVGVH